MRRLWGLTFILIVVLLSACGEQAAVTPTPSSAAATIPGLPVQTQPVSLVTLLRNPGNFLNSFVQVSGQYKPRPIIVCSDVTRRSPATWSLTAGELEVGAGGLDGLLRDLAPEGLSMVVEGRWRRWTGPVGCGRRPPEQTIWYLEVVRIVSPNPLTEQDRESEVVVTPQPTATLAVETTALATPVSAPTATETALPTATSPTETPAASATPTPTVDVTAATTTVTPTASPSVTPSATATGTPSATPTSEPQTSPSATPLATGVLSFDLNGNLVKRTLQAGQTHQWQFAGSPDTVATISLASSPELDVTLTLIGPNQQQLALANDSGAGGVETIDQFTITETDTYFIRVASSGSGSGSYALVLLNDFSEPFYVHKGNLGFNGSGSGTLPESVDHLYHFVGTAGQRITVTSTSGSDTDLVLYLLGPQATELTFVDDTAVGLSETISSFQLPNDGYYSIGVGDADFQEATYSVTLTRDS